MSRRLRIALIAAGVVVVAAGGAAWGVYAWAQARLEKAVARLTESAPDGVDIAIERQRVRVLDRAVRLQGVSVVDTRGGTKRRITVQRAELAGTTWQLPGKKRIPRVRAEGIRLAGPGEHNARLAQLRLRGVDPRAWRRVLAADTPGAAVGAPLFQRLTARDLQGSGPSGRYRLDKLSARDPLTIGGELRALTWRLRGLKLAPRDAEAPPPVRAGIAGEAIRADLTVRPVLKRNPSGFALERLKLDVVDTGTLAGTLAVVGVEPAAWLAGKPTQIGDQARAAKLARLNLSYRDGGLVARVLDRLAKRRGLSRSAYIDRLAERLRSTFGDSPFADKLIAFLREQGSLSVELAPEEPIGVMGAALAFFVDPQQLLARLNVKLEANQE